VLRRSRPSFLGVFNADFFLGCVFCLKTHGGPCHDDWFSLPPLHAEPCMTALSPTVVLFLRAGWEAITLSNTQLTAFPLSQLFGRCPWFRNSGGLDFLFPLTRGHQRPRKRCYFIFHIRPFFFDHCFDSLAFSPRSYLIHAPPSPPSPPLMKHWRQN